MSYAEAKAKYAALGMDTDAVIAKMCPDLPDRDCYKEEKIWTSVHSSES